MAKMLVRFYCGDTDGDGGCGSQLEIVGPLPSPAAQVNYFKAHCGECGQNWEVSHDMESDEISSELMDEEEEDA